MDRKTAIQNLLIFFLLLITAACAPNSKLAKVQDQLKRLQTQNRQMAAENAQLSKNRENLEQENAALRRTNEQLTESVQNLSEQTQKLKGELDRQRSLVHLQKQVIELLDDTKKTIESSLKDQIAAKGIEIVDTSDEVKVVLIDNLLYAPGSLEISEDGKQLLMALAASFKKDETYHIVVEGHTDNVPVGRRLRAYYPTNWELGAARASSVARFLQWQGGVDPKRLSIRSFASYRPVASNRTEAGRRQNRRIVITLEAPR